MVQTLLSYGKNIYFWVTFFIICVYFVLEYRNLPLNSSTLILFVTFPIYMFFLALSAFSFFRSFQKRDPLFFFQAVIGVIMVLLPIFLVQSVLELFKVLGAFLYNSTGVNIFYLDFGGFVFLLMTFLLVLAVWIPKIIRR